MTAETGGWIDTTFYPVSGKVIPPMLNPAIVFGRTFQRRLEFDVGGVAIAAKTVIMASSADTLILVCHQSMGIGKCGSVIIAFEINRFLFESMAFCAEFPSLSQFKKSRMGCGQYVAALRCACDQ